VLPEHLATVALNQANQNGHGLKRVINLQEAWAGVTGGQPRFPEAGIVVPTELAKQRPDLIRALLDELTRSVETINAAEAQTVEAIAAGTTVPAPVVADVIPRLNLKVVPAAQARTELEAFYNSLNKLSPDIIGGQLPDASFYLDDPR
jgi:NitT/TauT family transport system substrate-binding protein